MGNTAALSDDALTGLTIWLTRPRFQLPSLQAAIEARGGRVLALPMFEIEALEYTPVLKQLILNLDHYDLLFFISTNAAKLGMACVHDFWPQLPSHLQYFAIGPSTAQALQELDVEALYPDTGMNSEALLAMPQLQAIEGKRGLIFRGVGGREILAGGLRSKGVQVDYAEVYTRSLPDYSEDFLHQCLTESAPDAIVVSSSEALANLVKLLRDLWPGLFGTRLLVSSTRLEQDARAFGFRHVTTMGGANDAAIMESLSSLAKQGQ